MEFNNYDIRSIECALSSAISITLPVLTGENPDLQKNASGLVRTLQRAQNICICESKDATEVASYALKGVNRAKSELGILKRTVPNKLYKDYSAQLNIMREKFILYANQ